MDQGSTGQNLVLNLTRCCISYFRVFETVKHMGSEARLGLKLWSFYLLAM